MDGPKRPGLGTYVLVVALLVFGSFVVLEFLGTKSPGILVNIGESL